jgi:hypothetical protein
VRSTLDSLLGAVLHIYHTEAGREGQQRPRGMDRLIVLGHFRVSYVSTRSCTSMYVLHGTYTVYINLDEVREKVRTWSFGRSWCRIR